MVAREVDHLITPFECDLCIIAKLKNWHPIAQSEEDKKLVSCTRRINLDAFWSRAPTSVSNNLCLAKKLVNLPKTVGLNSHFLSHGPLLNSDHCSYQIPISMLSISTKPGRYDKSHT